MRSLAKAALLFFWVGAAAFTVHAEQKLTDISYTIKARLDTQAKKIFGEEKLRFKNNSGTALQVLYMHLKPNRLKEGSIQARTMGVKNFDSIFPYGPADAYLLIQELQLDGHPYGIGAEAQLDDTILRLNLAGPIDSGNYGEFSVKFVLKIPNGLERLGYFNENYYISWWYPELAVLDDKGWHLDPFREPYQNSGAYSMELTVPEAMAVGATGGFPESEAQNNDGTKTLKFSAQNVHDFAWVADVRYKIEETEWEGIKIRSLYLPENAEMGKLAATYSKDALEYFSKRFGKYPYPTFTSAQIYGLVAGAMEYPQLIMNGNLLYKFPKQSTLLDVVISHEIGHQWFFGMLMNNQPDETWLDEGFAEFAMIAYVEEKYGPEHNLVDLKQIPEPWRDLFKNVISDWRSQFLLPNYLTTAREGREEIVTASPQKTRPGHTPLFYEKGALTLFALEYLVGREMFDKILQTYVQNFQYKQVTTADFEKTAGDVYGQDLAWFFDEWLSSTKTLDFVFDGLIVERSEGKYINRVLVHQASEMHMPVDVQITLADGKTKLTQRWEGDEKFGTVTFITDQKAISAVIDPDEKLPDLNRVNNTGAKFFDSSPFVDHGLLHGQQEDGFISGINWNLPRLSINGKLGYSLGLSRFIYSVHYEKNFSFMDERLSQYSFDLGDDGHVRLLNARLNLVFSTYPSSNVLLRHELSVQKFYDQRYNVSEDDGLLAGMTVSYALSMRDRLGRDSTLKLTYKKGLSEWGSEYVFNKYMIETTLSQRVRWQTSVNARLFYGWKDGREPLDTQFTLQGDGLFRTFTRTDDSLLAINADVRFPIPQTNWIDALLVPISVGGIFFFDVATWGPRWKEVRAEAGIGLGIGIYPQRTMLRIEYPLWVNTNADGGKPQLRVRMGVSF